MKDRLVLILFSALISISAGVLWWSFKEPTPESHATQVQSEPRSSQIPAAIPAAAPRAKVRADKVKKPRKVVKKKKPTFHRFVRKEYSPADQKLLDMVQEASDTDDLAQVRLAATKAFESKTVDVRTAALDALAWFGEKALVDLTKAMRDSNAEVSEAARGHVEQALMGMENNEFAANTSFEYLKVFIADREARIMFSGVYTSTANQIVDPEDAESIADIDKAKANRRRIVENIVSLMDPKASAEVVNEAKEIYEAISGEEWTTRAAADRWAANIDDPVPPEEPEQDESGMDESDMGE